MEIFRQQAHVHVAYDPLVDVVTHRVRGSYTTTRALKKWLKRTGLQGTFTSSTDVAIGRRQPPAPVVLDHERVDGPREEVPEVVIEAVTGTLIPGEKPVGVSPITRNQEDIAESGKPTVAQFLGLETQNFGGGPTEDTHNDSPEGAANSGQGASPNLRALGARATLVLINGRRVAPSGSEGSFVDVDNIPLGAIDHVDIVPDGGSALYGTDAVGGVVNFVLQDRFSGAQMRAETGAATEGGQSYFRFFPRAGLDWGSGRIFVELEWYRQGALPANDRSFMRADLTGQGGPNFGNGGIASAHSERQRD